MVVQGNDTTISVTMDEMIYHARLVSRAAKNAMVVGDMPFMSYQISTEEAVYNAGRFLKEGGAHAVKLEGGALRRYTKGNYKGRDSRHGAYRSYTQSIHKLGRIQGAGKGSKGGKEVTGRCKGSRGGRRLCHCALEATPANLAKEITRAVKIPTIGIGGGRHCDGQVLVKLYDLLGLFNRFVPKFCKEVCQSQGRCY